MFDAMELMTAEILGTPGAGSLTASIPAKANKLNVRITA